MVQLSHLYMTTEKSIALTRQTFVGKVMSLFFNMLSSCVTAFLPRSKCLLISWLQLSPTMIWELKKRKSVTLSIVSPSICHEVMGLDVRSASARSYVSVIYHAHQDDWGRVTKLLNSILSSFKNWDFVQHRYFALILNLKKYYTKMLFILITDFGDSSYMFCITHCTLILAWVLKEKGRRQ